MTNEPRRHCRFCHTPEGQQHTPVCLYITDTPAYRHLPAFVNPDTTPPQDNCSCGHAC